MYPGRIPGAAADAAWLIVQTRAPAYLGFYRGFATPETVVSLGGPALPDEGHDLFHIDGGGGIACAQCHPEGGEDGRVWKFLPLGDRRTQALHVGLEGTEPFHWSGDLATFRDLVDDTFVRRMGALRPSSSKIERLQHWLFSLRPPSPMVEPDAPAAVRGSALFESTAVGCSSCHSRTDAERNESVDVGVESPSKFQIPRLGGIGYRAPFLHNGCAATLRDRFDPSCGGGDNHGTTSQLTSAEIDDLISYLNSL
jgi:mono/diheme cytochrome c family protein